MIISDKITSMVFLCGALLVSMVTTADETATNALLEQLAPLKTIRGDFIQESRDSSNTALQKQSGNFIVTHKGEFIWQIASPYEQKIISDARSLKIYDPDLEQLTIKSIDSKTQMVPLLLFSGEADRIGKNYTVTSPAAGVFELHPKQGNDLFEKLRVRFLDNKPASLEFMDGLHQTTTVTFTAVIANQVIDAAGFQFQAPVGADIIDER